MSEPYCGECNFFDECTDGSGWCKIQDCQSFCGFQCTIDHTKLTNKQIIKGLSACNKWRRGGKCNMPNPYVFGKLIDAAIYQLRKNGKNI